MAELRHREFARGPTADFIDTEAFYAAAHGRDVSRGASRTLGQLARQLDKHLSEFRADSEINRIRAEVLSRAWQYPPRARAVHADRADRRRQYARFTGLGARLRARLGQGAVNRRHCLPRPSSTRPPVCFAKPPARGRGGRHYEAGTARTSSRTGPTPSCLISRVAWVASAASSPTSAVARRRWPRPRRPSASSYNDREPGLHEARAASSSLDESRLGPLTTPPPINCFARRGQ